MDRYSVTVLPGGRITIPAAIRRNLDLQAGDSLIWWREGRELRFRKARLDEIASSDDHPSDRETAVPNSHPTPAEE